MASDFTVTVTPDLGELAGAVGRTAVELNLKLKEVVSLNALSARADFKKTTRTWNHDPRFEIITARAKDNFEAEIGTNDEIYKFIEEGTRVRRALMTPDFISKTKPGWLGSRNGRGGVVVISKKLALPGIKARNFRVPIMARAKKGLRKDSTAAVKSVLARFGN